MIRPSSLPMLAQCPDFEGKELADEDAAEGTVRHDQFSRLLRSRNPNTTESILAGADDDETRAGLEWAREYVQVHAPTNDWPLLIEEKGAFMSPYFEAIFGTPDAVCGPHIFDLKWRERDYTAQMAAYSLMVKHDPVTVHVLYAQPRRAQVLTFDREAAEGIVYPIIERALAFERKPVPCDYCDWCAKELTCPAVNERVNAVVTGREDWAVEQWHPSEIISPVEMGKALKLARLLAGWCESVEYHAKELALKNGTIPAGYKLQNRKGNRFISSVGDAFSRADLPQDIFLGACEVKFSALVAAMQTYRGMTKPIAERVIEEKLGDAVQRKSGGVSLVADKKGGVIHAEIQ